MALRANSFEGGTNATAVTAANSGGASGDAFFSVTAGATSAVTYSTEHAAHGTKSCKLVVAASETIVKQLLLDIPGPRGVVRGYFRMTAAPTVGPVSIMQLRSSASPMAAVTVTITGRLRLQDAANTNVDIASQSTDTLPLATWMRIELAATKGTTTSNGLLEYAVYTGDSTTPWFSWSSAIQNTGTADAYKAYIGRPNTVAWGTTYYEDDLAVAPLASGWIGAAVANRAPTVSAGADQTGVEPLSVVALTAVAADPDGTTPTVTWSQVGGSPTVTLTGSGGSRTFTAPATMDGTSLTFQADATDGALSAAPDQVSITTLPHNEWRMRAGALRPVVVHFMRGGILVPAVPGETSLTAANVAQAQTLTSPATLADIVLAPQNVSQAPTLGTPTLTSNQNVFLTDTFTGTNGTTLIGANWTAAWAPTGSSATIQSNRGRLVNGTAGAWLDQYRLAWNHAAIADVEVSGVFSLSLTSTWSMFKVILRAGSAADQGGTEYWLDCNAQDSTLKLFKIVSWGAAVELATRTFTIAGSTDYGFRFQAVGSTLKYRVWAASGSEPGTWDATVTDTALTSGYVLLESGRTGDANGTVDVDSIVITNGA